MYAKVVITDMNDFVSISAAAEYLGISVDTLRRLDRAHTLQSYRLDGKNRYFYARDLQAYKATRPLTVSEVATRLGVSTSTVRRLEVQGHLIPMRGLEGRRGYDREAVNEYMASLAANAPHGRQVALRGLIALITMLLILAALALLK